MGPRDKALRHTHVMVTGVKAVPELARSAVVHGVNANGESTEFEVSFLLDGVRYQYGFAMTSERIVGEHLMVYMAFKRQRWFERHVDAGTGKDVYAFGSGLKGPRLAALGVTDICDDTERRYLQAHGLRY